MSESSDWLPPLEPPSGGYARLTAALDARRQHRRRNHWRQRLILAGTSLALVALMLTPGLHQPDPQAQLIASSLQQAWAQADQELVVTNGAAAEMLKAPGLRVYWVGVAADKSPEAGDLRPGSATAPPGG